MNDDETRQPRSPEDYATMIMQQLGASTMADAWSKVATLTAHKTLVAVDGDGKLYFAPLTVRQIMQLMTALEGLTVQ
jgi:hypothetical protein